MLADAFLAMFEEDEDINTTLVEQPAAQVILRPENVADYDHSFLRHH